MPSKTQPDKMLPVTFGTHKKQKQCFCPAPSVRGWFRNHWRKSFGGRFRNTRTAAGFEPMPSKTQPDKMLPVTFAVLLSGTLGARRYLWNPMLSPCQAKPGPTKCFPLRGRSSDTIGASRLEAGSETPEQQQDSSPCQAKRSPTKCFPLPLEPIKNSAFVRHPRCEAGSDTIGASPLEAGSETPEQQQDSSPCQAKPGPTKCFPLPLDPIINTSPFLSGSSQTIGARPPKCLAHARAPKHPNSSRIRAHAKQNAAGQNASRYFWKP